MHSSTQEGKEGMCFLFNDVLNSFYLRLYVVGHMVKKPAADTWATLSDQQQGIFYMHHLTDWIIHTTSFVTPVVEHWLEREIAQCVHHEGLIRRPIAAATFFC